MRPIPERPFGAWVSWSRLDGSFGYTFFHVFDPQIGVMIRLDEGIFQLVWLKR